MRIRRMSLFLGITAALALGAGCDGDEEMDAGPGTDAGPMDDAGPGDVDAGPTDDPCTRYCDVIGMNCTGEHQQYPDRAECLEYCNGSGWPVGTEGEMAGNTIECRIYHSGVASGDPGLHCPHAGPTGADVCGTVDFRGDAPGDYTRVDRMGMPAVSTALIGSAMKNAYNDANPSDDAAGTFVPELVANNTALHTALDDDLGTMSLQACSMTDMVGGLPECFGQEIAPGGPTVASLVVPDTLTIDPGGAPGFPNGRQPADPVMDVTLAVILLEMGGTCGSGSCSPTTFAEVPLNPAQNDVDGGAFLTEFPYLQPPHTP